MSVCRSLDNSVLSHTLDQIMTLYMTTACLVLMIISHYFLDSLTFSLPNLSFQVQKTPLWWTFWSTTEYPENNQLCCARADKERISYQSTALTWSEHELCSESLLLKHWDKQNLILQHVWNRLYCWYYEMLPWDFHVSHPCISIMIYYHPNTLYAFCIMEISMVFWPFWSAFHNCQDSNGRRQLADRWQKL